MARTGLRLLVVIAAVLLVSAGAARGQLGAPFSGTLLVINFVQFMERMRPLLAERLGSETARQLTFHAADDRFTIARGTESITLSGRGDLALYLFGSHDAGESVEPLGSPALATQLRQALPFPALWYGVSYV